MKIDISKEQAELLLEILLNVVKNGNTANPAAFEATSEEYKQACSIVNKIDNKMKGEKV